MSEPPGFQAVSITLGSRPMIHNSSLPFWIEGQPKPASLQDMPQAMFYLVEAGFQQAMGVTLERGRFITPQDDERAPVVVDIDDDRRTLVILRRDEAAALKSDSHGLLEAGFN